MPTEHAPQDSDAELIERCLNGEDRAWSLLVGRYQRLVYSVPARHGLDRETCEDVFQAVWALAVRHLHALRDGQAVAAWLITTTQRETWRVLRSLPSTPAADLARTEAEIGTHAEFELMEQRQVLRESMRRLGDRCRELLGALFETERPEYDRIAERLGIPRGSIGPNRARCLDKLRELFLEAERASRADPGS